MSHRCGGKPFSGVHSGTKVGQVQNTCVGGCLTCPHPWTGMVITGAQFINGALAARVTDTGPIECPHGGTFMIVKGSPDVFIDGQAAARLGDMVVCQKCGGVGVVCGTSTDTFTNPPEGQG